MVETVVVYLMLLVVTVSLVVDLDFTLAVVLEDIDNQVPEMVVKVAVEIVTVLVRQILVAAVEVLALMVQQQEEMQVEKES